MYEEDDTEAVIDLCIADTQLENAAVGAREVPISTVHFAEQPAEAAAHNDKQYTDEGSADSDPEAEVEQENNQYFDMQHTQVDDGIYSDEEEEVDRIEVGGGEMFESTQVDEDYLRRLAESEHLEAMQAAEEPLLNAEHNSTEPHSAHVHEDSNAADGVDDGTESDGSVDFCIADTQLPPSRHTSLLAPRKPSIPASSQHTPHVEAVHADRLPVNEPTELTVYDYLSLSAPISGGEVPKPLSSTPAATPIFSALDALPVSTTLETNAFLTARSGPAYAASALSAMPRQTGAAVEIEEPTQLDGSMPHSSASQSVGKSESSLRDSASKSSRSSHPDGEHGKHGESSGSSLSVHKAPPTNTAALFTTPAQPPVVATPTLPAHHAKRSATESGEWLTAKRTEPAAYVTNNTAYGAAPASPPQRTTKDTLQNARDISVGESETQLGLKSPTLHKETPISSTFGGSLEDKSIEELVLMQQRLNQLITSKAQKLASPIKTSAMPRKPSAAHPAIHEPHSATSSTALEGVVSAKSAVSVPLARQETNYETQASQSQNSNSSVVAGLIMLKNDQAAAVGGTSAVRSPAGEGAGRRKFHTLTPSATSAVAAANALTASTAAAAHLSEVASPDSATKKHFKRKLGANKLAPLAEDNTAPDANQFEMSCDDSDGSDVASPHSSDQEQAPAPAKRSKPSPVKVAAPQKTKQQVEFSVPATSAAVTNTASANGSNVTAKADAVPASSSVVTKGVSKVRRIIIDDTQDDSAGDDNNDRNNDDNIGADDAEAEFDEANQSVTTSSTHTTGASAGKRNSAGPSAGATAAAVSLLPADIPVSFLHHIPSKFTELWHTLTDKGWYWKRGGGIVSYYYIRPGCLPKKGFVTGQDYFADEQEVVKFVSKLVREARAKMPPPPPPPAPVFVPAPAPAPAVATTTRAPAAAAVTKTHALTSQLSQAAPLPLVLPDDPIMRDIRKIPWKWLWKILREKGWTWDFGPTHKDFFYAPGFDAKSKHIATLGVEKFDSEESVRRFVRKQHWPEFCDPVSERQSQGGAESQAPDAYLHDPSWQLASHRQKRERERKASSGSDSESEQSESAVTRPTKMVKKAALSGASAPSGAGSGKGAGNKNAAGKVAQSQAQAAGSKAGSNHSNSSRTVDQQAQVRNFSPFKGAHQHSQQQQHQEAEQATQAQHASPASPMRSIRGSITVNPAPAHVQARSTDTTNNNIFEGHRFVVSGIPEKLKASLVKEISKRGGSILASAPIDGNENQHDRLVDDKTGRTYTRGPVHVVSHPREFRKPNYLLALATGVDLVHFQWVQDCVKKNQFLAVQDYILPTGCCALGGFNVFPARYGNSATEVGPKATGSKYSYKRPPPSATPPAPVLLLENVKVLNFAGSSWDNLLLVTGATTIQNNAPLLQSLLSLTSNAHRASHKGSRSSASASSAHGRHVPVDLILVDPYEYSLSLLESAHASTPTSGRYATPNSLLLNTHTVAAAHKKTPPSSALKIGAAELQAIQKCVEALSTGDNQSAVTSVPIVVTTDWLVHCLAMGRLLDYKLIDFFTLPSEPVKRPFTHKMDSVQGSGERYSKYDIVYYTNPRSSGAGANVTNKAKIASSPVKAPKSSDALCMGRIDSFVRRDEKSPLMVRIRPLVRANAFGLGPADALADKELTGDPHNALCLIEVDRLAGKLVLLHKDDFLRVSQYSVSDDCVYYASEEWLAENPSVLDAVSAKDGDSDAGSEGESEPSMRPQRSQDY